MASSMMVERPTKQDVDEGTFALCVSGSEYKLYQFNTKSPLRSRPDWREVDSFKKEDAPPMSLENAVFNEEDGKTWAYDEKLEPEYELREDQEGADNEEPKQQRLGTYVLEFSDGQTISGNTQAVVMGKTIDHMVKKYDLLEKIDIPYMSGSKNALINNRENHPDGRSMRLSKRLTGGFYVSTEMDGDQKRIYKRTVTNM